MITHDSWQRIKEIFQSAQQLTAAERVNFLDQACGDDVSIREEVEALLTADESNDDFLTAPAYEFAADILAGAESEFTSGHKIGPYTILCPLGAGGMGQIYLAEDTKLRRKVAIKLISQQFASDQRRVRRFEYEALAVSSLNHPNICVIYEVGVTENDRHFIAMEYIQGVTLREQMSRGPLPVPKALNIAIQVSAALASAHASGIVHRDIKPENIMLRPDGYVKVLDFGLAKLTEVVPGPNELSTNLRTEAGMLMGTIKYMSPEQLRETKVDERSDIWSLGVVLHEMVTGKTPFDTPTSNDTIAAILAAQPTHLKLSAEIPSQLRDIMTKSLEKDRDERYQTVMKFASDLRQVQIRLQREADSIFDSAMEVDGEPAGLFTRLKSQALLTTEFFISEIRSHKTAAVFAGATAVLAVLLLLPAVVRQITNVVNPPSVFNVVEMKPVTNAGTSICSAGSSDGQWIVSAEEKDGKQQLVLTSTATLTSSVILPPSETRYLSISFTRDNNYIYFIRSENDRGSLYRLPLFGTPVKLKDAVDSPISWSPKEDQFTFVRLDSNTGLYSLIVSSIDDLSERVLATRSNGVALSVYGPSWSPDGKVIVCPIRSWNGEKYEVNLSGFSLHDGREQIIGSQPWFSILQIAWQPDMSGLVISARDEATRPFQLWQVAYPSGAVQRITNDLADYRGVSLSGRNIITVRSERKWVLFVAKSADNYEKGRSIASGVSLSYGLAWAGNDRIVFSSMGQDKLNISRIKPDGTDLVQLTVNVGDNYTPAATADGKFIVFSSNRTGKFNIWRMSTQDGSDLKQLTFTDGNFYPSVSPDGQWIVYDNQQGPKLTIWRVPFEGGVPTNFAADYRMPEYSPDSQFIAARYDLDSGTKDLAIFSAEGNQPLRKIQIPVIEWQRIQWLSGHTLAYVKSDQGSSDIWSYDLDDGSSKQLTHFKGDLLFAYAWSPDRQHLAYQLGTKTSNVVLIRSEQ
ncbi:MAG TPA: protein kinase [Pyrinomonadaceae bacterium]|nr:protein kinase [Pyrinomonadaceae bacterium]